MFLKPKKYLIPLLLFLIFSISCVDDDLFTFEEPEKISSAFTFDNVVWSPAFTAPIGKTSLKLGRFFEGYNDQIQIVSTVVDSLSSILDTLELDTEVDTTIVIFNDSIYMSTLPTVSVDTIIDFSFGLDVTSVSDQTQQIKYVTLIFNITNNYPTQIESQAYFLDSNRTELKKLFTDDLYVGGGKLNNDGRVISSTFNTFEVTLYEEHVNNVSNTSYLYLETEIGLRDVRPEHLDEVMSFFSEYKIEVQIAVDFQIEVELGEYQTE